MIRRLCSISDCDRPIHGKGLCDPHYRRLLRYGDPLAGRTPVGQTLKFFENVVLPYTGNDCLIWPFTRDSGGYAQIWHDGWPVSVSRLTCERVQGLAPTAEHHAAHSCGKGHEGCVNPRHLRWATPKENQADKIIHGTVNNGERHGRAKLTEADVRAIRQMPGTHSEIATKFGVNRTAIGKIKSGKTWQHLTEKAEA